MIAGTNARIILLTLGLLLGTASCALAAKVDLKPAQAALDEGRYRETVDLLLTMEKSDPRNNDLYRMLGAAYLGLGDSANAEQAYGRAVELKPGDRDALLKWTDVLMARGKAPEAVKALQKSLKSVRKDPEKAVFNDAIGRALLASGNCTQAQEYLLKATIQDEKNIDYHLDLGQAYFDCQVFSLARLEYEKVLAENSTYCMAQYRIGVAQFRDRAFNDALVSFGKAYLCDSSYIPVYYDLALLYVLSARSVSGEKAATYYQNALYYFERYRKSWPDSNRVLVAKNVSLAYYFLRDYEKAAEELARAVDVGVQDKEMLFLLGRSLQLLQRYDEAITRFNEYESRLTDADTANVELYPRRAACCQALAADSVRTDRQELLNAAVGDYQNAIAADTTDERSIVALAGLLDRLGRNEEAIPWFDRMTQLHPLEARYWFNAALPRLKLKRETDAVPLLMKAMETDTTAAGSIREQARKYVSPILLKSGRFDEAREFYKKLIAQEPNNCDHLQWHAYTYYQAQQWELALPHLEKSYECFKRSGKAPCQMIDPIKWLATAYIQIPKPAWDKARPLVEQGLKCDPNDRDFKELQKAIKNSEEIQYTPGTKAGQQ